MSGAKPIIGMNTDSHPLNSSDGTTRFVLNGVVESVEGDLGSISNEEGNTLKLEFPEGFRPIGWKHVLKGYTYWVSVDDSDGVIISKQRGTTLTTIMYIVGLGMRIQNQVKVKYRVINGGDDLIYLTDGYTSIKAINLSRLEDYLLVGETVVTANADGLGWDLSLLDLFPKFDRVNLSTITVNNSGGNLKIGTYSVVAQYLTETFDAAEWMDTSDIIPIIDENSPYNEIDGGFNSEIPFTTKSITLTYTNVDTSYTYLRIATIANIDGVVTSRIVASVPINSETLTYTITGNESSTVIPLEDIVVANQIYNTAEDFEIYDNRMWLLNLGEFQVDHAVLQEAAFNILAKWVVKDGYAEALNGGDTKDPEYYIEHRSHMRDEVYRYAIEFYFNNGYITQPYLLASRQKDVGSFFTLPATGEVNTWHNRPEATGAGWDSSLLTITNTYPAPAGSVYLGDVEHLGYTDANVGESIERWTFCNTATVEFSIPSEDASEGVTYVGEMAYCESTELYPDNDVFGSNAGQPIRDFKFPDTTLIGIIGNDDSTTPDYRIYPMGIKFTNIVIPAQYENQIVGYKILRVQRDYSNSSVVDKGLLTRVSKNTFPDAPASDFLQQAAPYNWINSDGLGTPGTDEYHTKYINETFQCFHGHRTKIGEYLNGDYLKVENILSGKLDLYSMAVSGSRLYLRDREDYDLRETNVEDVLQRKINAQVLVQTDSFNTAGLSVNINNTEQQEAYYIELNKNMPLSYGVSETETNPTEGTQIHFYYGSVKKYLPAQYGAVEGGVYIPCSRNISSETDITLFAGDTFISPLYFRRCARHDVAAATLHDPINDDVGDTALGTGAGGAYEFKSLIKVFSESIINMNFRNEGDTAEEAYYPKSFGGDVEAFILQEGAENLDLIPNFYQYNNSFSQENNYKPSFGFYLGYDYEDENEGKFPFRLAVSNQINQESKDDQFRIFLPNNYRDLPNTKGVGLSLFVKDDKLFASLENSTYNIPVKAQEIRALDATTYIGTGEILSLPEQELMSTDYDYGGLSSKWCQTVTPYGVVWANNSGKIFLLSNSIETISSNGLKNFFQENGKFYMQDKFIEWAEEGIMDEIYIPRNNANPNGLGWHSTYDPKHHRVIFTKRDYLPLFPTGEGVGEFDGVRTSPAAANHTIGGYVYNTDTGEFEEYQAHAFVPLDFSDPLLFENKSFTISYSFITNSWTSFHSYIPYLYATDLNTYYSVIDNLWEHNTNNMNEYYGDTYEHIIDFIIKAEGGINVFDAMAYISKASKYDSTSKLWYDVEKTFSSLVTYNTTQCSGESTIINTNLGDDLYLALTASNTRVIAERLNDLWRLSGFRDLATTPSFFTKDWTALQSEFFIDKVLQNIDYDKDVYQLKAMKDHWLGVRLTFNQDFIYPQVNGPFKVTSDIFETQNYSKIR